MNKNKQRVIAFLLALILSGSLMAPALAAERHEVHIQTAQDLVTLSRNCSVDGWSAGKTVYLDADIDLSGTDFQLIPIFGGTFYGQGHTISDLYCTVSGVSGSLTVAGLFHTVGAGGTVQNLNVVGSVSASGGSMCSGDRMYRKSARAPVNRVNRMRGRKISRKDTTGESVGPRRPVVRLASRNAPPPMKDTPAKDNSPPMPSSTDTL